MSRPRRLFIVIPVSTWLVLLVTLFMAATPARLYRVPDNETLPIVSSDGRLLASAQFSHAGSDEVVLGQSYGPLRIRDARSGRLLHSLGGGDKQITGIWFTPDGSAVWATHGDEVLAWDTRTGNKLVSGIHGRLHSLLTVREKGMCVAVVLVAEEDERYDPTRAAVRAKVQFIDTSNGQMLSSIGPIQLLDTAFGPTLAIGSNGSRAMTMDPQRADPAAPWEIACEIWEPLQGRRIGALPLRDWPRAWGISDDEMTLWLVYGQPASVGNAKPPVSMLQAWDLNSLELREELTAEPGTSEAFAINNALHLDCLGGDRLRLDIGLGKFYLDTSGASLKYLASEGLGNVVSEDASLRAFEEGKTVDASPPFVYVKSNRSLVVQSTQDEAVLFSLDDPGGEATARTRFKPLALSSDHGFLVYEEFKDSLWARTRSIVADLINMRVRDSERIPTEIHVVDLDHKSSRVLGIPLVPSAHSTVFPNGDCVLVGREAWTIEPRTPVVRILGLSLIPFASLALISLMLQRRRKRGR